MGEDGQPIEGAAPVILGEDGQPIPQADAAAPVPEPEPVVIRKKTPPPFEFRLDLPPEGAEVPFVRVWTIFFQNLFCLVNLIHVRNLKCLEL